MRHLGPALAAAVAAFALASVTSAGAAAETLGSVAEQTHISAAGGWVAWGSGASLVAWHDGTITTVPLRSPAAARDIDVGTDAAGRPMATYSSCSVGGCHVRVVDLRARTDRAAGIPRARWVSDGDPSMWGGRIAFARHDPQHHGGVQQIRLWSPRTRTLRTLPHGAIPTRCPYRRPADCKGGQVTGTVRGLDLGADLVSFVWQPVAPAVVGDAGYEVRADRVSDGRSTLVGSGYLGEVCTGGTDGAVPSIPTSDGTDVWYSMLTSSCYRYDSELLRYRARPVRGARAPLPGIVLQVAKDGANLYALVAPRNVGDTAPRCTAPGVPCTIERLDIPPFTALSRPPGEPFF